MLSRFRTRRAAFLDYVSNLLLRSLPEIDRENDTQRFPPKLVTPAAQSAVASPTVSVAANERWAATKPMENSEVTSDLPGPQTTEEGKPQKPN